MADKNVPKEAKPAPLTLKGLNDKIELMGGTMEKILGLLENQPPTPPPADNDHIEEGSERFQEPPGPKTPGELAKPEPVGRSFEDFLKYRALRYNEEIVPVPQKYQDVVRQSLGAEFNSYMKIANGRQIFTLVVPRHLSNNGSAWWEMHSTEMDKRGFYLFPEFQDMRTIVIEDDMTVENQAKKWVKNLGLIKKEKVN